MLLADNDEPEDHDEKLKDFATEQLSQVKIFLQILYGSCVRFYSTVLDWEYIQGMREDLIERLTSLTFEEAEFSHMILYLCRETIRDKERQYNAAVERLSNIKPKDLGISLYFTCDETSKLEQVYLEQHPDANIGDSGSSAEKKSDRAQRSRPLDADLTQIEEDPAEDLRQTYDMVNPHTSRLIDNYMDFEVSGNQV